MLSLEERQQRCLLKSCSERGESEYVGTNKTYFVHGCIKIPFLNRSKGSKCHFFAADFS